MKVSIIGGGGLVGSSAGFALQCGGVVREIALLDVRAPQFPAYEELAEQLRRDMLTRSRDDLITRLREEAVIEKVGTVTAE